MVFKFIDKIMAHTIYYTVILLLTIWWPHIIKKKLNHHSTEVNKNIFVSKLPREIKVIPIYGTHTYIIL